MRDGEGDADAVRALPMDGVLDLHAFHPRDVVDLVPTWLDACRAQGLRELRIVHGKGRGVQRATVHAILARRDDVESYQLAPGHRGGWGATLVTLRQACPLEGARTDRPTLEFATQAGDFTLTTRQLLRAPREDVFAFLADPRNLGALMPPFVRFELRSEPPALRMGVCIDYRIAARLLPLRWRSAITIWEPPARFVHEQLRGPYTRWRHEQSFEAQGGHTLVSDHVAYRVPGGRLVHTLFVRPELRRIFAYRRARLTERFGEPVEA